MTDRSVGEHIEIRDGTHASPAAEPHESARGQVTESFASFELVKARFSTWADEIESVWNDVRRSRPAVAEAPADGNANSSSRVVDADQTDPVQSELAEVRVRLQRAAIEVGIFGESNRGKSTLLNSMLGTEVSRMLGLPGETVVPVWIEGPSTCQRARCPGQAHLIFDDGAMECVTTVEALRATGVQSRPGTERRQRGKAQDFVDRYRSEEHGSVRTVVQHVDTPLLQAGMRIVDSPGLSDPSLQEFLEELALAELDRVSAALVVFLHLPGIGGEEIRLLRSLKKQHKVDKAFLVCNVTTNLWNDEPEVLHGMVLPFIQAQIEAHNEDNLLDVGDLHIYPVNALMAWESRREQDEAKFAASGVPELLADVERYLAEGVLQRLSDRCLRHLDAASRSVSALLDARIKYLQDPHTARQRLQILNDAKAARQRACDQVLAQIAGARVQSRTEFGAAIRRPYTALASDLGSLDRTKLQSLNERLRLQVSAELSRVNQAFERQLVQHEEMARRELRRAFDLPEGSVAVSANRGSKADPTSTIDISDVRLGSIVPQAVAAAVGAAIAAPLAGGIGIALIAAGPVGLVVGAILGAVYGSSLVKESGPSEAELAKVRMRLTTAASEAERAVTEFVDRTYAQLESQVRERFKAFEADADAERRAIASFLNDTAELSRQIDYATALRRRLPEFDQAL